MYNQVKNGLKCGYVSWHLCVQVDSILINDNTAKKISKHARNIASKLFLCGFNS